MAYPVVQNVPLTQVRTNLDGTTLPDRRKAYALAAQGGYAPVARASASFVADSTIVTVFDGVAETAYYVPDNTAFTFWKTTYTPVAAFGTIESGGNMYEILFVRVPGASTIAGLCLANP